MFPKTGNKLHRPISEVDFAKLVAEALVGDLGSTHRAVKMAMRWTGASERTVKHWLAGTHAPRGPHLLGLVRHSDRLLAEFLRAAGRDELIIAIELSALRSRLTAVMDLLDGRSPDERGYADNILK